MCAEGRPDDTRFGRRIYAGDMSDAYLQRADIQRGYTIVIWRGRHVAEPTELSEGEAAQYWRELLIVGRALEAVLDPVKLNYDILGNSLPHLHTHVVPRYADDPRPGWPFPFPEGEVPNVAEEPFQADAEALRSFLRPNP
jgi:diadenosine tetraphosphate (Ap4A) HIT family hydrolase